MSSIFSGAKLRKRRAIIKRHEEQTAHSFIACLVVYHCLMTAGRVNSVSGGTRYLLSDARCGLTPTIERLWK